MFFNCSVYADFEKLELNIYTVLNSAWTEKSNKIIFVACEAEIWFICFVRFLSAHPLVSYKLEGPRRIPEGP